MDKDNFFGKLLIESAYHVLLSKYKFVNLHEFPYWFWLYYK